ncbi:ATP-binding protein [Mucilaginibacter sp. UC70_90]
MISRPAGNGKTLTASLLGKYTGKPVFRIDLSMIVSKFIGETEKNLSKLFEKADNKNWILFFDEADALFGKRTNVKDAHDKYANQEASYLLQRVEQHNGLVILATNFKNNIDEAFMRRFQSVINFPLPNADERYTIWQKSFPPKANLNGHINLEQISRKYELSGSGILNVVQFACLQMLARKEGRITSELILEGIEREYTKENRVW